MNALAGTMGPDEERKRLFASSSVLEISVVRPSARHDDLSLYVFVSELLDRDDDAGQ